MFFGNPNTLYISITKHNIKLNQLYVTNKIEKTNEKNVNQRIYCLFSSAAILTWLSSPSLNEIGGRSKMAAGRRFRLGGARPALCKWRRSPPMTDNAVASLCLQATHIRPKFPPLSFYAICYSIIYWNND